MDVLQAVLYNIIEQIIDLIVNEVPFDFASVISAGFEGLMNHILNMGTFEVPKYIRDIKKEAREKFIKGTKKLTKYLHKKILTLTVINLSITCIYDTFLTVGKELFDVFIQVFNELISDFERIFSKVSNNSNITTLPAC